MIDIAELVGLRALILQFLGASFPAPKPHLYLTPICIYCRGPDYSSLIRPSRITIRLPILSLYAAQDRRYCFNMDNPPMTMKKTPHTGRFTMDPSEMENNGSNETPNIPSKLLKWEDDPANAHNWSLHKKLYNTAVPSLLCLLM